MQKFQVFVSSKTEEFKETRIKIKQDLEDYFKGQIKVFVFEDDSGAKNETPQEVYSNEVINSNIYVGIFKNEYSEATENEYKLALDYNKIILIYVNNSDKKNRDNKLTNLIKKIQEKKTYDTFENDDELIEKLKKQIIKVLAENFSNSSYFNLDEFEYIEPTYFTTHTKDNFNEWKKGFPVNLAFIKKKKEFQRENILREILHRLDKKNFLILMGRTGFSKSIILNEILCYFHEKDFLVYKIDGKKIVNNPEKIIKKIEFLINLNKKIFIAIDNAHSSNSISLYYIIDKIQLHDNFKNIIFLLTARIPDFDVLRDATHNTKLTTNNSSDYIYSFYKLANQKLFHFQLSSFTKEEIKLFVIKYDKSIVSKSQKELRQYVYSIYKETKGYPIFVFYRLFGHGLKEHIKLMKIDYLNSSEHIITMVICSLFNLAEIEISDDNLKKMQIIEFAYKLNEATLLRSDSKWNTLHPKWDEEFFKILLEKKQYFETIKLIYQALDKIFSIENSEITYKILLYIYKMIDNDILLIDEIDQVRIPNNISSIEKSDLLVEQGIIHYNRGFNKGGLPRWEDWENSIKKYDEAINLNNNNHSAYIQKGNSYHFLEKFIEAIEQYKKSIELNPTLAAYVNLINSLRRNKDYSQVEEIVEQAKNYLNKSIYKTELMVYYNNVGLIYMDKYYLYSNHNDFDIAKDYFQKSIDIQPNELGYANLATLEFFFTLDYEKSLEYFKQAYNLNQCFSTALEFIIKSLMILGREPETKKYFIQLKKIHPILYNELRSFFKRKDWMENFHQVIRYDSFAQY